MHSKHSKSVAGWPWLAVFWVEGDPVRVQSHHDLGELRDCQNDISYGFFSLLE